MAYLFEREAWLGKSATQQCCTCMYMTELIIINKIIYIYIYIYIFIIYIYIYIYIEMHHTYLIFYKMLTYNSI